MFIKVTHAYKMLTDPYYRQESAREEKGMTPFDLTAQFRIPVSFEVGFFGRKLKICYNPFTFNKDGSVINLVQQDKEENRVAKVEVKQTEVDIHIEAGVQGTINAEIPNKGNICVSGEIGKAIFSIIVQPHHRFQMDNQGNIIATEMIPLDLMLKGGATEIQTMYGLRTMNVPPGSKPGDTVEIKNCGVKQIMSHIVAMQPIYPSKDQLKKDEAWKNLDINWELEKDEKDQELESYFTKLQGRGMWFQP